MHVADGQSLDEGTMRPSIRLLYDYWRSIGGGGVPERDLVDPAAIKHLLPYLMLVEFTGEPFRIRYRLTGTRVDEFTGLNLTGRYLDEFCRGEGAAAVRHLEDAYRQCAASGRPYQGVYEWQTVSGYLKQIGFGLFPLCISGSIRQCLSIEDYSGITPDIRLSNWAAPVVPA